MPQAFRDQTPARGEATQKPLPPRGLTTARSFLVCDLGTQEGSYTDPGTKKVTHWVKPLIKLGFELPLCLMPPTEDFPDPRPFALFKEFTWSMNSKGKFGPFCESIFGPRFEIIEEQAHGRAVRVGLLDGRDLRLEDLLNVYCKVNVMHTKSVKNGLTYANAGNFSEFPEPQPDDPPRFQRPPAFNNDKFFSLDTVPFDTAGFDSMYQWDREKIQLSKEWERMHKVAAPLDEDPYASLPDPDIPF